MKELWVQWMPGTEEAVSLKIVSDGALTDAAKSIEQPTHSLVRRGTTKFIIIRERATLEAHRLTA